MKIVRQTDQVKTLNRNGAICEGAVNYLVSRVAPGPDADNQVLQEVRETAPAQLGSARRDTVELVRYHGNGVYSVRVNYRIKDSSSSGTGDRRNAVLRRNGDTFWSYYARPVSEKCYTANMRPMAYTAEGVDVVNDPGFSLNWNGKTGDDSKVAGTSITVPRFFARCRKYSFASNFDAQKIRQHVNLCGKVNAQKFHHWEPGEALFRELDIFDAFENDQNQSLIEAQYIFAIVPNRENFEWNGILIDQAQGHEHVWGIGHADPFTGQLFCRNAFVSTVYESADFGLLDLG